MLELVELGVSWVWMGLESPKAGYSKLQGKDVGQLTRELREHGIRVQGSTIVGLEHHTPDNIVEEIESAVDYQTDFHQFMLYTPVPGTPLYQEMSEQGRMLTDVDFADVHGQFKFNFRHAAISREDSKRFLDWAFWRDFERNGPSLYRMCQTMLQGWQRYKDHPDPRVRERFAREVKKLSSAYNAALWVMEREFKKVNRSVSERIHKLRREVEKRISGRRAPHGRIARPDLVVVDAPRGAAAGARDTRTSPLPLSSAAIGFRLRNRAAQQAAKKYFRATTVPSAAKQFAEKLSLRRPAPKGHPNSKHLRHR